MRGDGARLPYGSARPVDASNQKPGAAPRRFLRPFYWWRFFPTIPAFRLIFRLKILAAGLALTAGALATGLPQARAQDGGRPGFEQPTDPLHARGLFIEGLTLAANDRPEEALSHYREALALSPEEPAIFSAMADAYAASGESSSALLYAQQALARAPDNPYYQEQVERLKADRPDL